jgi:hypothetical protein
LCHGNRRTTRSFPPQQQPDRHNKSNGRGRQHMATLPKRQRPGRLKFFSLYEVENVGHRSFPSYFCSERYGYRGWIWAFKALMYCSVQK